MKKPFALSTPALIFAIALAGAPAAAQVCAPSYSQSTSGYSPSYATSYQPAYATPYAPPGCPEFSTGQWIWNGAAWTWCPANAYAPVGEPALVGYYGLGAPLPPPTIAVAPTYYQSSNPGLTLALGLAALALMPQQTSFYPYVAYAPYGSSAYAPIPYYFDNPAYVGNPAYVTASHVHRLRIVRVRDMGGRMHFGRERWRIAANHTRVIGLRQARAAYRGRFATAPRRRRPPR